MTPPSDFCAFILTHGRPDRVHTFTTLRRGGYTGPLFIVIDDEDSKADAYRRKFGESVVVFSKAEIAARFDEADNFGDRRAIFYARNACYDIADRLGFRYFLELDDDYNSGFFIRFNSAQRYGHTKALTSLDEVFSVVLEFFLSTPAASVALSQGGDHIGGSPRLTLKRKAMNSFFCAVDRRVRFQGRINEDVNTYAEAGRRGELFFTVMQAQVNQLGTQSNSGGMTDLYLDCGTYVKTFYSVMFAPSCVKVASLGDPRSPHYRIHHEVDWRAAVPVILREEHRKVRA